MSTLFINGKEVEYTTEPNLLEVIRKAGFNVPTFCYRPDLTPFGACRMCVVEIEYPNGRTMINSSCTMPPEPNIKVLTNTARTRRIRKTVLELLLANHDRSCLTCERSVSCELQQYSEEYGLKTLTYEKEAEDKMGILDDTNPAIVRDPNKCILCGACVRACAEHQGHSVLGFANRGCNTVVQPMGGKHLDEVDCVFCGQCVAVCPTGALTIKNDVEKVWAEITNPEKKVVAQIAPAVRVALGEMFGLKPGENTIKLINAALKAIGFDLVFDTNFSADLTIMEEGTEFLSRLKENKNLPIFTSCCPAWVTYVEKAHPEMIPHLSTCKSPQGMLASVIRKFVPEKFNIDPEKLVSVSIMPCTAKKTDTTRPQLMTDGRPDVDYVLTTQELGKMIKSAGIKLDELEPIDGDFPYGEFTGAGTIFGTSGGVAEAAARTAYELATGKTLQDVDIKTMRGLDKSKITELDLNGTKIKVKVVSTLKEAEKCIQEVKEGKADYQMLEVMACPGGCINGGGQPLSCNDSHIKEERSKGLYADDKNCNYRKSHDNPAIKKIYEEYFGAPNSHKAHEMLHTSYGDKYTGSYKDLK